jgi:hypothetical protein
MSFIRNDDLIYSKFTDDIKDELAEFQHELIDSNNIVHTFDTSKFTNYKKLIETFFSLRGYYTEIDNDLIYVMLHD